MIPTQDPTYTAMHLLRAVRDRSVTAHFGLVRGRKPNNALLGGSTDREHLVKSMPQETLVIGPTTRQETLAAAITAVWARLAVAIRKQVAG
jgi:hypothetical protein